MPGMPPGLVADLAVGEKIVAAQLPVAQIREGRLRGQHGGITPKGGWQGIPEIGGYKHHVNGGAMGDGELPGLADVIEQLLGSGGENIGLTKILQRGHRQPRQDGDDGQYDQQFDQGKTRCATDIFHGITSS